MKPRHGRRRGWGSQGDCRLPGGLEEIHAALLGVGGGEQQQRQPFHLLRHQGLKKTTGVVVHLLSLSVPSSFSQLVCGSLQWRLLPPSAAGQN